MPLPRCFLVIRLGLVLRVVGLYCVYGGIPFVSFFINVKHLCLFVVSCNVIIGEIHAVVGADVAVIYL